MHGLLLELYALTLDTRSYVLLIQKYPNYKTLSVALTANTMVLAGRACRRQDHSDIPVPHYINHIR